MSLLHSQYTPVTLTFANSYKATYIFRRRWRSAFAVIYCARAFKGVLTSLENKDKIAPGSSSETFVIIIDKDYGIDQPTLAKLVREKNLEKLDEFGGVEGIAASLNSNVHGGINSDDAEDILRRTEAFGKNTCDHRPQSKGFFHFVWKAFRYPPIVPLLACATLALGFNIKEHGRKGWYDGGSMFIAVFLVIFVSAISNLRQSRLFDKFSKSSDNIQIEVVRNSTRQQVPMYEIVVGDVACLKTGDQVPTDGLFIDGDSLRVDESSMSTGESDHVEINSRQNPFLISGTKVADGYGRMLVTAVGMNSTLGESMASDTLPDKKTLQEQLNNLSSAIGIIGTVLAFVAAVVVYLTRNKNYKKEAHDDGLINVLVECIGTAANTAFVAIPGGLPLAVTLTLSYSLGRIMANKATVRKLSACESMNSVTTICIGKGGTLTGSDTMVTKFWLGNESIEEGSNTTVVSRTVLHLLHQAVQCLNKPTSAQCENEAFSLNSIEKAISSWPVLELEMKQVEENFSILQVEEFNSEKRRGVLIQKNADNTIHVHWQGAAEMILEMCSHYYHQDGDVRVIKDSEKQEFIQIIQATAASGPQFVALAHKQILEANHDDGEIKQEIQEKDLILLAIIGLKDPCKEAVKDCQDAGVNIKMITGDNILKAEAIATEFGLLGSNHEPNDGSVIKGAEFRSYTDDVQMEKVDRMVVMAGSSPFDKNLMVKLLKRKGHVVAVIGDGEKDAQALKEADIGLFMGVQDTRASKEFADIIISNENFSSVVRVLIWGRCTYNNIQKFTQFQLTANISGIVINFFTAVLTGRVPLTALEALWVNVIINPLGALALATERPTMEQMEKPRPVGRTEPLITNIMWRNQLGQALYQIGVILALQLRGESVFGVSEKVNDTLVYNTFVLCQVFNEFNGRRLERMNIFEGIHRNKFFLGIVGVEVTLQVVLVEFLKRFADTERLDWGKWAACAGIAAASWPIGLLIKFIPVPEKPFGI